MASFADIEVDPEVLRPSASEPTELFQDHGAPIGPSDDLDRVVALPRREPLDLKSELAQAYVEYEMAKYSLHNENCECGKIDKRIAKGKRKCIKRLKPEQAWMLYEMRLARGLIAQAGVGIGKTLVSILAPLALELKENQVAVLLIPVSLVKQIQLDYQLIAQHFRVPAMTVHMAGNQSKSFRAEGVPTLHVVPYSLISQTENSDKFEQLQPAAIIADECDALKDRTAGRTIRFLRYFSGNSRMTKEQRIARLNGTRFCGWTGSLTDSSITEYQHLALLALRAGSPLPMSKKTTAEWAGCLDAVPNPAPEGELRRLCEDNETAREGFRRRQRETLGFIIIGAGRVKVAGSEKLVELTIQERKPPPVPKKVMDALKMVRKGVRPDTMVGSPKDEILVDKLQIAKCAVEVACGMFYRWKFPPIRGVPQKREHILKWYEARKEWNSELRERILRGDEFMDTAKSCENAAARAWGDLPQDVNRPIWRASTWPAWRDIKNTVVWEEEACWLDDWLARDAVAWGRENIGIIWYLNSEFAKKVWELSGPPGQRYPLHAGGAKAEERIMAELGDRTIIASLKSHGRGRNGLQYCFNKQLITQTLASGANYEQLFGRMERDGQTQEVVETFIYLHTEELKRSFRQALRKSEYVTDTLVSEQLKLTRGWSKSKRGVTDV